MDEDALIATVFAPLATAAGADRLGDDAAAFEGGAGDIVVTCDALAAGVHFFADDPPAAIAAKSLRVNLSDLAAKGAEPVGVLIGHMLGNGDERFVEGLRTVLAEYGVALLGGDTVRAEGRRVWGCTAIGRATSNPVPDRRGAKAGDAVYVTGTLGRAMLGFETPEGAHGSAYRRPVPRLAEGRALAPIVTAMMDISDGLLLDCWRLAEASGTRIELDSEIIPVADPARRAECLRWGDDYELLFTAPSDVPLSVQATRIGTVSEEGPALLLDGEVLSNADGLGYSH